jgi:ribosomal protein L9
MEEQMDRNNQFAVYSDFREGFLIGVGPSLWHYDVDCAIRFETEKEARTAAARRQSDLAVAVRLKEIDGVMEYEALVKIDKALPGTWTITVKDARAPGKLYHLVSSGRVSKMSTSSDDAKGYKLERDAIKAAEAINKGGLLQAEVHQKTAQVLSIQGSR